MTTNEGTITSTDASEGSKRVTVQPAFWLLRFAWVTVPLHVGLGVLAWWLMLHDTDGLIQLLIAIHVGFPVLLIATIKWWWRSWGELLVLLFLNHTATFAVLICLPWE